MTVESPAFCPEPGVSGQASSLVAARARDRLPLTLTGRAWCKVDATYGPIALGDLLTTSSTPGHAMTASDPSTAFGAVIGKALRPWNDGTGLVPVLVALQ